MTHFYPDASGLILDDSAHMHRAQGLTEWFNEAESAAKHTLCPCHNQPDRILAILFWSDKLSINIMKTPTEGIVFGSMVFFLTHLMLVFPLI